MINQRRSFMNVKKIRDIFNTSEINLGIEAEELAQLARMYQTYESAQQEIATKLENLDAEFQLNYNHNPIHHLEGRMKDPQSLMGKLQRKGLPLDINVIPNEIFDIAGIRVITNYIDDIYTVERLLVAQDDVKLLKRKDYVKDPKPSGYRSLHLVVEIPVFMSTGVKHMPVEIQVRTIGMDMWASLEHKLRYKTDSERAEEFADNLIGYANELNQIEQNFQNIHREL
ncbi:GTP pyrophosphokinase [Weissella confusa]|uniref:GTP pyrophosphokinase n=1 Tax=Weissella confusa TaxID=1583 RepID=A0A4Z0RV75_WEICO|nr:GTP pyrophosphokinase family protein [Weissella confusa]TGE72419.1 GTP pyrophosphokinase [Weissella confusa]